MVPKRDSPLPSAATPLSKPPSHITRYISILSPAIWQLCKPPLCLGYSPFHLVLWNSVLSWGRFKLLDFPLSSSSPSDKHSHGILCLCCTQCNWGMIILLSVSSIECKLPEVGHVSAFATVSPVPGRAVGIQEVLEWRNQRMNSPGFIKQGQGERLERLCTCPSLSHCSSSPGSIAVILYYPASTVCNNFIKVKEISQYRFIQQDPEMAYTYHLRHTAVLG